MIIQFLLNGFITGLLYALVAMAFSFTYNTTKIFHIAFAGILVAASYILYFFINAGLPAIFAILLTLVLTGLLNLTIEKSVYQPLDKRRNSLNTLMIASIGVFTILINLIAILFGNENKIITNEINKGITLGSIIITQMQLWQLSVSAIIICLVLFILAKTRWGFNIKALSNNKELYVVLGNNVNRTQSILTFFSGALAAVVSILLAYDVGFDPYFGMPLLLNALVVMILGGIGNFYGTVIGGVILGILQSLSVYYFEARWETAITFVLLLALLIIRPQGIFGQKLRLV